MNFRNSTADGRGRVACWQVAFSEATRGEAFLSTRESTAVTAHSLALVAGQLRVMAAAESQEDEDDMDRDAQDSPPKNPVVGSGLSGWILRVGDTVWRVQIDGGLQSG